MVNSRVLSSWKGPISGLASWLDAAGSGLAIYFKLGGQRTQMTATRFFLDGMIYNELGRDTDTSKRLGALVDLGAVEVIATPALVAEMKRSPFGGIPNWFKVVVHPEGIAISGLARSGMVRSSTGVMFKNHLGHSNNGFDAIIAHSAHSLGATLVSNDNRSRNRLKQLTATDTSAVTYAEFRDWIQKQN